MAYSQLIKDVMTVFLKHCGKDLQDEKVFVLRIDARALRAQRTYLTLLLLRERNNPSLNLEALEGIRSLLNAITCQAFEWYGMNTLRIEEDLQKP